jgi:hypothetical protein
MTTRWLLTIVFGSTLSLGSLLAGDPPAPSKLSTVAPAADLVAQAKLYVEAFGKGLASEQDYKDNADKIKRDANTLTALALVLGNHDADNELKAAAPALIGASQELAKAADYAAAKSALENVRSAIDGKGERAAKAAAPKWAKVASMGQLMKQVTFVNNRLKRSMRRFGKQNEEQARDAAVLAAIAQAVVYDTHEVKNPGDLDRWYQLCGQMRDAAGELNAKVSLADKAGAEAALLKLAQSCDDCHKVFRIEDK